MPAFSDQITGFVNGQNSSVVTGTAIISTTASSTSTVAGGPYPITIAAGTLSAPNYTFTNLRATALSPVNPAPLTVTANNASMVYGAAVPALSDQITGFVNGQNSSVVTGTPTFSTTASSTSTVAGGPYTDHDHRRHALGCELHVHNLPKRLSHRQPGTVDGHRE